MESFLTTSRDSVSGIFQVMFSVIAMNFFQLAPEQNGYLMAYFGIVSMVWSKDAYDIYI